MTLPAITNPFEIFLGLDGEGLDGGQVYIGIAGMDPQTNPQATFWDEAGTIAASQPLPTAAGYLMYLGTPAKAFTASTYSIKVLDVHGVQVFYKASVSPNAKWAEFVSPTDYGASPLGVIDARAAFVQADAVGTTIFVPKGAFRIASDLTLTSPLFMQGGSSFVIPTGVTLTLVGSLDSSVQKIFTTTGTGKVVFSGPKTVEVIPEWWGAIADGTTDSYPAIQAAVNAFPNGGGKVLLRRPYAITDTILVIKNNMSLAALLRGSRYVNVPHLTISHTTNPCVKFLGTTAGGNGDGTLEYTELDGVICSRSAMGIVGSKTIIAQNVLYCDIRDCGWSHSQYGLYAKNAAGLLIDGKTIMNAGGDIAGQEIAGIYIDGTAQGSTGVMVKGLPLWYGGESPTASLTAAYLDRATGGSAGAGDRQIDGLQCSGSVGYIIYIQDGGGFSADLFIREVMADACQVVGIYVKSPAKAPHQQLSINDCWINLTNAANAGAGIQIEGRKNCQIDSATILNAGNVLNKGLVMKGSQVRASATFDGVVNWARTVEVLVDGGGGNCNLSTLSCTGNNTGDVAIGAAAMTSGSLSGNTMPFANLTIGAGSNFNHGAANVFNAVTDSGTGNSLL